MENASELKKLLHGLNRIENRKDSTLKSELKAFRMAMIHIFEMVRIWNKRINGRNQLVDMNDRLLKDIGITRDEARKEYRKHFWEE